MAREKMVPPLPEAFGGSEQHRFKRFAKAVLAVPKADIIQPGEALARLQAEKQKIDAKIGEVRRELAKRRTPSQTAS